MNRVTKRYLATLGLGIAFPVIAGAASVSLLFEASDGAELVGGLVIVGSFVATAALVAHEKGRFWPGYALAGWIAPLLPIVLLLPHTKERRAQLLGIQPPAPRSDVPPPTERRAQTSPQPPAIRTESVGTGEAIALGEANQFLRFKAESRSKVDAQASFMHALLTRADSPPLKAVVLRSVDSDDEFPWLIVKSGTRQTLADIRNYAGSDAIFKELFGDQARSISWADHIAENCPGPGETVTALGRERYEQVARRVREGKYVVERRLGRA